MDKLILLAALFCFGKINAQCNSYIDNMFYKKAYNYIVTDSIFEGKSINVSRELTGSCYICFFDEIKSKKDTASEYKEFYELDKKYESNDSVNLYFEKEFETYTNSNITLYFSVIINKDLFAEIKIGTFEIDSLGESVFYYFTFDSYGNIEHVYKKMMHGL